MIRLRNRLRDRQGSALILLVVAMLGILSMMALALDLGMLRTAHGEAQRAADAAALAGASAFLEMEPEAAAVAAPRRAVDFAIRNTLQRQPFAPGDVTVDVLRDRRTVRVKVRKPAVPTWFAQMFGVNSAPVSARAAAHATYAPSTRCVKPFVPPDLWHETDDDHNRNGEWDPWEVWEYEPDRGDYYNPGGPGATSSRPETGYGSTHRGASRDRGRKIMLNVSALPGFANLWAMPDMEWGNDDIGGSALRQNISGCNSSPIRLGTPYRLQSGIKTGPIFQGITDLVARDPGARWDEGRREVVGSSYAHWMDSPRLIRVPLHDPAELQAKKSGVEFTKFAWVFLEPVGHPTDPIVARFVEIVRVLQLVE
ncbi:MAG TPA: pilus assembly protein TadG-related protein [Longimicrobium sp.]|nr:pilus assembly protein TadG-related protein [Longimicrobium sp.]